MPATQTDALKKNKKPHKPSKKIAPKKEAKSTKRIGPNIDPCGTPDNTGFSVDLTLSKTTHCSLSRR